MKVSNFFSHKKIRVFWREASATLQNQIPY